MKISYLAPFKAKYYANVLLVEWQMTERFNRQATKGLQTADGVSMNRVELKAESTLRAVSEALAIDGARIRAAFPANKCDFEKPELFRLEVYDGRGIQLQSVAMHELDESLSKVADEELLDLVMTYRGL